MDEEKYTYGRLLPRTGEPEGRDIFMGNSKEFSLEDSKGKAVKVVRPETTEISMQRVPVKSVAHILPERFLQNLEQNQKIATCCRHPENHSIEGWKSHPSEPAPDIYIFICDGCGRKHRIFCVGETDLRPVWNRTLKWG